MSATTVKRKTQAERREQAESRMLEVAIRLVAQKGYEDLTLAEVGQAAGYSRGLPAHYFGHKEDLVAKAVQHAIDQYQMALVQRPPSEPGLPQLAAILRNYARITNSKGNRALGMLIAQSMVRPVLRKTVVQANERGLVRLENELRAGIKAGNIRPDIRVKEQARVIYAFLRGQIGFVSLDPDWDPGAIAEEFILTLQARLGTGGGVQSQ